MNSALFGPETYSARRARLREQVGSGLVLLAGNRDSPMNYRDNVYPFRQDSSFLYYFGLARPGLAALIDADDGVDTLFGDDQTLDQIVWTGPLPTVRESAAAVGVTATASANEIGDALTAALRAGREVHFLPPYRATAAWELSQLLDISPTALRDRASTRLIDAIFAQRSVKTDDEVAEIERALEVSHAMHTQAMRLTCPGRSEEHLAGVIEGIALARGRRLSFPLIFTARGEILHNYAADRVLKEGEVVIHDSGADSPRGYASDITRTLPVGGRFSPRQAELYGIVLDAQSRAIEAIAPGVEFREVHRTACRVLFDGLAALGVMRGDPDEAVAAGAHAIVFQCGLGHLLGLDVHDMEALGEDRIGYGPRMARSDQFGTCFLRLARALEPGFVVTVEPGLYFNPLLIDRWRAEKRHEEFIDYTALDAYRDARGYRIEDDVLVTADGARVLGKPLPKAIGDVEAAMCA